MHRFAAAMFAGFVGCSLAVGAAIQAGFAERDITPAIGQELPSYRKILTSRFHDPCKVRVAVFSDGDRKVALVGVDALLIPRHIVLQARSEIARICGIPPQSVMIGATHSHTSGPVGLVQPGEYDRASVEVRRLAAEETSNANPGYLLRLTREIVQGVKAASDGCVPAQLGFGFGEEREVAFNRRLKMKQGVTWSHPGAMNPDIVDYAAPIDPQVGVIGAWDMAGNLLGTVVNFSCHATTDPGGISANWPYYLERTIQGALHTRAPVVFLQGASGDVTQVDNLSPYVRRAGAEWAQLVGGRVGAEAVKVLLGMARSTDVPLDSRARIWQIKRRAPSAENIARARKVVAAGKAADPVDRMFARETLLLEHLVATAPAVEVEVQAIQVGPAVCISNPAEYFVEFGLDIKKRSPFPFTFPVALANGIVGYVPTEEAFGPSGGGYETRLTSYSNLEITAGRQFADAGVALSQEMIPGPKPERLRIDRPGTPWAYGNVPPQKD